MLVLEGQHMQGPEYWPRGHTPKSGEIRREGGKDDAVAFQPGAEFGRPSKAN